MGLFKFDHQGIVGFLMISVGLYCLLSSIVIIPSCNWKDQTPRECGSGLNGEVKNRYKVQIEPCLDVERSGAGFAYINSLWSQWGFLGNPPIKEKCLRYGCHSGCLKSTTSCTSKNATSTYECVSGQPIGDISPPAPFVYSLIILGGAFLHFSKRRTYLHSHMGWLSILVLVAGLILLENSMTFQRGCNHGDDHIKHCDSVMTESCSNVTFLSPFASNIPPKDTCLLHGCAANQCLKTVYKCSATGKQLPSYSCEASKSFSYASPLILFLSLFFVLVGVVMWFTRHRAEKFYDIEEEYQEIRGTI